MTTKRTRPITVGFVALGCPKNMVDSERMLAEIARAGLVISAESNQADVVVINTCGFIEPAKQEAIEAIKEAVAAKKNGKVQKVIVAGCLSQRLGKKLFGEVDGIDCIVGLNSRDDIASIIERTAAGERRGVYFGGCGEIKDDRSRLLIGPKHRAYLRISEGCNRRCSFCTIPAIRGPFRSKPLNLILAEARELANAGVMEISIISQDTTSYGKDLKIKDGLPQLLRKIEKIDGLVWIRLMYLHPVAITENLLHAVAESRKIVHYLDIPIQHINNSILRRMRRPGSSEKIYQLIEKIRAALPDAVLRTTLIVGFPGETDEQFDELIEFVKWAEFDALGAFKFYAEEGTPAAALPNQVPEIVKQQRFRKLMLAQQKIAFEKNRQRLGSRLLCLVDQIDGRIGKGRYYGQAPDIDSVCIIKKCRAGTGEFIKTRVAETAGYDLVVEQV
jgi:ribosomal protein S12 methylthiotransferase